MLLDSKYIHPRLLFILKLTIFIVLFIDTTQIPLLTPHTTTTHSLAKRQDMSAPESFRMPTKEEQEARVAEWEAKLKDKYLVDDTASNNAPSSDAKADEQTKESDETDKAEEPQRETVLLSSLPQPLRIIKPGSRITRDLRPNRMNVVCDENGLILKVQFY
ncbi:hypothetical protein LPJ53_001046 [Coemansia erecta]|uniref:Uncharacterized protein n=1 Tax=Coemansia erecta TaxID=147472 RepID=A0A9W7Y4S3_9FUNG|nr:hypothetical protein LPJ53_001046 [Coemansia erecta]